MSDSGINLILPTYDQLQSAVGTMLTYGIGKSTNSRVYKLNELYISSYTGGILDESVHISIHKNTWNECGMFHITSYLSYLSYLECSTYYTAVVRDSQIEINKNTLFAYNTSGEGIPSCTNFNSSKQECLDFPEIITLIHKFREFLFDIANENRTIRLREKAFRDMEERVRVGKILKEKAILVVREREERKKREDAILVAKEREDSIRKGDYPRGDDRGDIPTGYDRDKDRDRDRDRDSKIGGFSQRFKQKYLKYIVKIVNI